MKRFAFLVFISAVAISTHCAPPTSEEYIIAVNSCIRDGQITESEMMSIRKQFKRMREDIIDETMDNNEKYRFFQTCLLEQVGLMKDSKLDVDRMIKQMERYDIPIDEDIVRECLNSLNDNSELTREDRAVGARNCKITGRKNKDNKDED